MAQNAIKPLSKRSQAPQSGVSQARLPARDQGNQHKVGYKLIALITHSYGTCERLQRKGFAIRQAFAILRSFTPLTYGT